MSFKNQNDRPLAQLQRPWTDEELRAALPLPAEDANKYSRGVVTVFAGSKRYPGAACLASRAAQRMGAGYTEVVTNKSTARLLLGAYPSLVVHDVGGYDVDALSTMRRESKRAICIGPGFVPGDKRSGELLVNVLKKAECPVLVDGGGLAVLGTKKAMKALAHRQVQGLATVITPHTGEAGRLAAGLRLESESPRELAAALAQALGTVVVSKGPDTYISQGQQTFPMYEGTPALAKAGTGDVLAGMIASLLAQGVEPVGAAILGATLHARAGVAAAQGLTVVSVTPEDLIKAIPLATRSLVDGAKLQ